MSEKKIEVMLTNTLKENDFNMDKIFYDPNEHNILKNMFKKCSKSGTGRGIPDRIYFDEQTIIIFECKRRDINKALADLKSYKEKLSILPKYRYYFVAFVEDAYDIYDINFSKINKKLCLDTFTLRNDSKYSIEKMNKDIHRIHNYIRDYTKISNEDKAFFIACILISLKKKSFIQIIKNYDTKLYIYDLIKQNLVDFEIDVGVFEFLRNDENNKHLLNIICMILNIYVEDPECDMLNKFYSEFVKYNNSDGKGLGIVLTPEHIVRLMIEILDITPADTFLDLCAGTGSFALEAIKYKPETIIAVEYQSKLYTLLKCNMILRNVDLISNEIIKGDCFEYEYKATKSAINPPYSMKDKKELEFIIKQLESVEEGGLVCAIVPVSKFNSNSTNNKFKRILMKLGQIELLILNRDTLFYPYASTHTGIILIRRGGSSKNKIHTPKFIDYRNDGIEIKKQYGPVKTPYFDDIYKNTLNMINSAVAPTKTLLLSDDWFSATIEEKNGFDIQTYKLKQIEFRAYQEVKKYRENYVPNRINFLFKSFKIKDLFTLRRGKAKIKDTKCGIYPLITSSYMNNGVAKYVDTYSYENCITVANNGSVCSSFYQEGKFECTSDVTVLLNPIPEINDKNKLLFICCLLEEYKQKYNYGFKWSISRMGEDTLRIPVNDKEMIDFSILI